MFETVILDAAGDEYDHLTQWDQGQSLKILKTGLADAPMIHFCNKNSKDALKVPSSIKSGTVTAEIPNILLQSSSAITAYVVVYASETSFRTVAALKICVKARPRPSDYAYVENVEYTTVLQFEEKLAAALAKIENMNISAVASDAAGVEIGETNDGGISLVFALPKGDAGKAPRIGENGNWVTYNSEAEAWEDTGIYSGGMSPRIGENGNWFVGDVDTGVSAKGSPGYTPQKGVDYFTEEEKLAFENEIMNISGVPFGVIFSFPDEASFQAFYDVDNPDYWNSSLTCLTEHLILIDGVPKYVGFAGDYSPFKAPMLDSEKEELKSYIDETILGGRW